MPSFLPGKLHMLQYTRIYKIPARKSPTLRIKFTEISQGFPFCVFSKRMLDTILSRVYNDTIFHKEKGVWR